MRGKLSVPRVSGSIQQTAIITIRGNGSQTHYYCKRLSSTMQMPKLQDLTKLKVITGNGPARVPPCGLHDTE